MKDVILTGTHGCGKTTLLNAIKEGAPSDISFFKERIEDARERGYPINKKCTPETFYYLASLHIKDRHNTVTSNKKRNYFDRGIIDYITYAKTLRMPSQCIKLLWDFYYMSCITPFIYVYLPMHNKGIEDNGFRDTDIIWQLEVDIYIFQVLQEAKCNYYVIDGTVKERKKEMLKLISQL